jgi:hypothetical protein
MMRLLLLAALLALSPSAYASEESDMMADMLGGRQFGRGKEQKAPVVKSDLPFIRCGTCDAVVKQMGRAVAKLRETQTAAKKVR